jgi:hypothetical protein
MRNNQPVAELSIWNNLLELLHRIGYALRWPIQQKNLSAQFRTTQAATKPVPEVVPVITNTLPSTRGSSLPGV